MERNKKVVRISALTLFAAGISLVLWLAELVLNGLGAVALCGVAAAIVAVFACIALIRSRKGELAAMEKTCEEICEESRVDSRQAIRHAEEKNHQEMEQFRSTLSHSLRMPISIIQGYADLLADDMVEDPETQKEYLKKISARTQYMSDVIRRQRLASDGLSKGKLVFERVDMLELVDQVVRDMQTAAEEANVRLQVLCPVDTMPVTVDAYLINRVFYNLLENAMKYMRRPGVVTIRLARQGSTVTVHVQDDGVGMESEEVEHIFEKNYQGSNRISGQGYGLFLVKESVEAHGGSISARSAPGQGMGITIHLPCGGDKTT